MTKKEWDAIAVSGNSTRAMPDMHKLVGKTELVKAIVIRKTATEITVRPLDGKGYTVTFYCDHDGDRIFYEMAGLPLGGEVELYRAEVPA